VSRLANVDGASCATGFGIPQLADPFSSEWNSKLAEHPGATIFHTTEWARVLQESYGYTPYYYRWQEAGGSKLLCLSEVNSWLTGHRASSLPFADEAPALGVQNSEELQRILHSIFELAREQGWKRIEIRGIPKDWSGNTSGSYITHELNLSASAEVLFENCGGSTRRAIRKAEREGVKVEVRTDLDATEIYYKLHCLTRRKHGVPPQPRHFFQSIHQQIISRGLGFIVLASLNGEVLAGSVFFTFQGKALYKFGASNPQMDSYRPSNLVMWRGIQHLVEKGMSILSFGRTDLDHDGLRRYKIGWGTCEKRLFYIKYNLARGTFLSEKASPRSNYLFQVLPRPVLKRIGAFVYPHLG
jgi:CelD/BcsL family acetyltransferase involved in cellulose biosynthesis